MFINVIPDSQKIIDQVLHALIENIHVDQLLNFISPIVNIKFIKEHSEAYFCYLRSLREPSDNADLFNEINPYLQSNEHQQPHQLINRVSSNSISPEIPFYSQLPCSSRMLLRSQSIAVLYSTEFDSAEENKKVTLHHFQNGVFPDVSEIAKKIGNLIEISEDSRVRSKSVSDLESMYLKISPNKIIDFFVQLKNLEQLALFLTTTIKQEKLLNGCHSGENCLTNRELIIKFLEVWEGVLKFFKNGVKDQVLVINTLVLPLTSIMLFFASENCTKRIDCSVLRSWSDHHMMDLLAFDYEGNGGSINNNLKSKLIEIQLSVLEAIESKFKTEAVEKLKKMESSCRVDSLNRLVDKVSGIKLWDIVQFEEKLLNTEKCFKKIDQNEDLVKEYKIIKKDLEEGTDINSLSFLHSWFNNINFLLKII